MGVLLEAAVSSADRPLGLASALRVLDVGRVAFFGSVDADLPTQRSALIAADDLLPQFGFVGSAYSEARVVLLGINPGNGHDEKRNREDEIAMPALRRFVEDRSIRSFLAAQHAYQQVCQSWHVWRRHCSEVIGAGKLSMEQIAYSNCLPWRTASESGFADSVARNTVRLYVKPLIEELQPNVVVALGKRAAQILSLGGLLSADVITWNRAQAATAPVLKERADAARRIFHLIGRR